jgi:hypothetical protein
MNPGMIVAAAREDTPMSNLTPLTAITAVHALCRRMKTKLVTPTSQVLRLRVLSPLNSVSCTVIGLSSYQLRV